MTHSHGSTLKTYEVTHNGVKDYLSEDILSEIFLGTKKFTNIKTYKHFKTENSCAGGGWFNFKSDINYCCVKYI